MNTAQPAPLPPLKKLTPAVFRTILRSKQMGPGDFHLQRSFYLDRLDDGQLNRYAEHFGFSMDGAPPLSYLYLIAQPAQAALMLDRRFPLPLPGMVHFNNRLSLLADIDPAAALTLSVDALIEAKPEGSLFPKVAVDFLQKDRKVARCESGYFVRRKSGGVKKKREEEPFAFPVAHEESWALPPRIARVYADLSGDVNPIHLSDLFARLTGFKGRIAHGWYALSRGVATVERRTGEQLREISVHFKKPVLLPSQPVFSFGPTTERQMSFQLSNASFKEVYLTGTVGY